MISSRIHRTIAASLAVATLAVSSPVAAQSSGDDARLRKIEAELRALQREVFPGGDGRFFTPEIDTAQQPVNAPTPGTPSPSVLTDVLTRLEAIEAQLARLTARTEEGENRLGIVEEKLTELESQRIGPMLNGGDSAVSSNVDAMTGNNSANAANGKEQPEAAGPSPERLAAVQAIAKPQTEDAGDDEYVYGFRLWEAKLYPEARQQLRSYVDNYPDHWRQSYGRNLLGRAYLDDGMAREAATWFFENYQSDKQGVRAPDSLLYLAKSMIELGDTNRACIALAEFGDKYAALASGRLSSDYEQSRGRVDCN